MRLAMHRVLVLGAGKIGSLVACLLSESGDYEVHLGDISLDVSKRFVEDLGLSGVTPLLLDVRHPDAISAYMTAHRFDAVLSSLPYFCNPVVAGLAREHRLHYFDLTEDVEVTNQVKVLSADSPQAFVPQCGLAPGIHQHCGPRFDHPLRYGGYGQNAGRSLAGSSQ